MLPGWHRASHLGPAAQWSRVSQLNLPHQDIVRSKGGKDLCTPAWNPWRKGGISSGIPTGTHPITLLPVTPMLCLWQQSSLLLSSSLCLTCCHSCIWGRTQEEKEKEHTGEPYWENGRGGGLEAVFCVNVHARSWSQRWEELLRSDADLMQVLIVQYYVECQNSSSRLLKTKLLSIYIAQKPLDPKLVATSN